MPVLKNIRHEKFCQALFRGEPAVRAYESAGYKVHQSSSSRLRWFAMVQQRLAELQAEAIKDSQVSYQSLMNELEDLRVKAVSCDQYAAGVRAVSEKIKLSGLATQKIEVSEAPFTDNSSAEEILAAVIEQRGMLAGWYLAKAFNLNPADYGIAINGAEDPETRQAPAVAKTFRPAVKSLPSPTAGRSQFAAEERRPVNNGRKREI